MKVPDGAPLELLGPLACGIQTGAGAVLNALKVPEGKSFAVFGAGSVGLSAVMAAKVAGARTIIAVDLNPARLELAKELGATHVINPNAEDATAAILALTGTGVHYALDTTGLPPVIRSAVMALANAGTCGILGASGPDVELQINEMHFMSGGRRLMGIVEGESEPDVFIPHLVDLYKKGLFPFDKLITFFEFDEINEAIHASETGSAIKPILRMK